LSLASALVVVCALALQSLFIALPVAPRSSFAAQLSELSAAVGQAVIICEHDGDASKDGGGAPAHDHAGCNDCCTLCSTSVGGMAPPVSAAIIVAPKRAAMLSSAAPSRDPFAPTVWAGLPNPARGPPFIS
jgi:hypothetical protein